MINTTGSNNNIVGAKQTRNTYGMSVLFQCNLWSSNDCDINRMNAYIETFNAKMLSEAIVPVFVDT